MPHYVCCICDIKFWSHDFRDKCLQCERWKRDRGIIKQNEL